MTALSDYYQMFEDVSKLISKQNRPVDCIEVHPDAYESLCSYHDRYANHKLYKRNPYVGRPKEWYGIKIKINPDLSEPYEIVMADNNEVDKRQNTVRYIHQRDLFPIIYDLYY
ncbi:hypothetical protein [Psychrobacter sp. KCTC 72983]|uniref:hypothetical protein n=1 Tax=Psychrobacter sp. KCTC 72983 TaxID=2733866 RepID=UPI001645778E|nr:hypothetical protein [Psychrobacter sp. KCTC 72983]